MGKGGERKGNRRKTTKTHTTALPMVEKLLTIFKRLSTVDKVSLGVIKPGLRPGKRRIKIRIENSKVLLLKARDVNAVQEVRVYSSDPTVTRADLVSFAEKRGWGVSG